MLWREQRREKASRRDAMRELYPNGEPGAEAEPDLEHLRVGMRHAAAAYGSLASLLSHTSTLDKAHGLVGAVQTALERDADTVSARATAAAARSAGIESSDILAAEWCTLAFSPVGRCKLDPSLKATCFQPLNLRVHILLST